MGSQYNSSDYFGFERGLNSDVLKWKFTQNLLDRVGFFKPNCLFNSIKNRE